MAVQEITIAKIKKISVETKDYGTKYKWLVNDAKTSSFVGKWNADWDRKIGQVVKADVKKNGEYTNLGCPPELRQAGFGGGADLKLVHSKLDKILSILEGAEEPQVDSFDMDEPEPANTEDFNKQPTTEAPF